MIARTSAARCAPAPRAPGPSSTTSGSSVDRARRGRARSPIHSVDAHALAALDEHAQRAVGHLEHARDGAGHADVVELLGAGLVGLGVAAGDHHQHPVAGQHVVDERDRARLADRQRRQRVRERDGVAQRQDRQRRRHRGAALGGLLALADGDHASLAVAAGVDRDACAGAWAARAAARRSACRPRRRPWRRPASTSAPSATTRRNGAVLDLELLVHAVLAGLGGAPAGQDQLAPADLERDPVRVDAGEVGADDRARRVAGVVDVDGGREAAAAARARRGRRRRRTARPSRGACARSWRTGHGPGPLTGGYPPSLSGDVGHRPRARALRGARARGMELPRQGRRGRRRLRLAVGGGRDACCGCPCSSSPRRATSPGRRSG